MIQRTWAGGLALVLVGVAIIWLGVAVRLEGFVNRVEPTKLPEIAPRARALHYTSFVADLHGDSLLFGRDLLTRSDLGHIDMPRLHEGGVGLQVFAVPTVVPLGANIDRTAAGGLDLIRLAGFTQLSPTAWMGPTGRALYRAQQLRSMVDASDGGLMWIDDREDLTHLLDARAAGAEVTGALLAIEGAHALESDPDHLQRLFDAGYRMIGLAHFFDNDYAGSAHGETQGGLTPLGRETILEMERLGMTIDLAHLSPRAVEEVLDLVESPTVFSHGGVRGTCDNARNLSDEVIDRIARGGGVIGIGYWDLAVCGTGVEDVARAIAYVAERVGPRHVALGSDYDGGTTVGFDTSQLPALTQALFDVGLTQGAIRQILGGNVLRVLSETLPASGSPNSN